MYTLPSRRRSKESGPKKLNLVPILDAVFILIFFLLISANFLRIFEISSEIPLVSSKPAPPPKKPPLMLLVEIKPNRIVVKTGTSGRIVQTFMKRESDELFPYEDMHQLFVDLKVKNSDENTAILEPDEEVDYDTIVRVMDSLRMLRKTDQEVYVKDKDGIDIKLEKLFDNIVIGNITS